jgi:hypothetical protein
MASSGVELVALSDLVQSAVASTHAELLRISRSTQSAEIRKEELKMLLRTSRRRFAQLIVLTRWAPQHSPLIQRSAALRRDLELADMVLGRATFDLHGLHAAQYYLREPPFDVPTAVDMLGGGGDPILLAKAGGGGGGAAGAATGAGAGAGAGVAAVVGGVAVVEGAAAAAAAAAAVAVPLPPLRLPATIMHVGGAPAREPLPRPQALRQLNDAVRYRLLEEPPSGAGGGGGGGGSSSSSNAADDDGSCCAPPPHRFDSLEVRDGCLVCVAHAAFEVHLTVLENRAGAPWAVAGVRLLLCALGTRRLFDAARELEGRGAAAADPAAAEGEEGEEGEEGGEGGGGGGVGERAQRPAGHAGAGPAGQARPGS